MKSFATSAVEVLERVPWASREVLCGNEERDGWTSQGLTVFTELKITRDVYGEEEACRGMMYAYTV